MKLIERILNIPVDPQNDTNNFIVFSYFTYGLSLFLTILIAASTLFIFGINALALTVLILGLPSISIGYYLTKNNMYKVAHVQFLIYVNLFTACAITHFGLKSNFSVYHICMVLWILYSDHSFNAKVKLAMIQTAIALGIPIYALLVPPVYNPPELFNTFFFIVNQFGLILISIFITRIFFIVTRKFQSSFSQLGNIKREMFHHILSTTNILNKSSDNLSTTSECLVSNSKSLDDKTSSVQSEIKNIAGSVSSVSVSSARTNENIHDMAVAINKIDETIKKLAQSTKLGSEDASKCSGLVNTILEKTKQVQDSLKALNSSAQIISDGTIQIDSSLHEISKKCEHSTRITGKAAEKTEETNLLMIKLDELSKQIGNITVVIKKISDKTKMVALNAAIEAQSAGSAGTGFIVVANEVKDLARQTLDSTQEIDDQIRYIRQFVTTAGESVATINSMILEVSDITRTIAAEVNRQSLSAGNISSSVSSEANEISHINSKVNEIVEFSMETSKTLTNTSGRVLDIANSANDLLHASNSVNRGILVTSSEAEAVAQLCKSISTSVEEIISRVHEINQASLENSKTSQETSLCARELYDISKQLDNIITQYSLQ